MSALALNRAIGPRAAGRVREMRAELLTIRLGGDSFFESLLPSLRELLGIEVVCAYGLRQLTTNRQELSFHHWDGGTLDAAGFHAAMSRLVEADGVNWAAFNPSCPERSQRNRVIMHPWTTLVEETRLPRAREVFASLGVGGRTQLRVLLCEGPSLLGWVGGFHVGDCDTHQQAIFTALVPALQRRLATERQIEQGMRSAIFDTALDAIGRAAFVCDARGRIREANRIARELLQIDGRAVREELARAVHAPSDHSRWDVTGVRPDGSAPDFLVLERTPMGPRLSTQVNRASLVWRLTPRQTEVLEWIAEGNANRTIAAIAGLSERTVEVHVTALLEKAQVESRAELIAKTLRLE